MYVMICKVNIRSDFEEDFMKKYKKDIIVVLLLFVVALGFYVVLNMIHSGDARCVKIYKEDALMKIYPLNEDGQYEIKTENGFNQIIIEKGFVYIKDANCPDKLCVKQGKISKTGESIICLPHKIVVKIASKEEAEGE